MRALLFAFAAVIVVLTFLAARQYTGNLAYYLAFSIAANLLLWAGFRTNALFFDAFIGVFFWLGFWLKLSVRIAFFGGHFYDPTGNFDGSPAAFDAALLVCLIALAGLIATSYAREKLLFVYPPSINSSAAAAPADFYLKHRTLILSLFLGAALLIASTNFFLGIYQRGLVARTDLPFGMGGLYTWLLLFGLATFSAVILNLELRGARTISPAAALAALLESFLTNTSMLSRGMVLNLAALAYGALRSLRVCRARLGARFILGALGGGVVLFACSVVVVNAWRAKIAPVLPQELEAQVAKGAERVKLDAIPLLLDRWVGIEPVMAVSSYPHKGWGLWNDAWKEKPSPQLSFYDRTLIMSPYAGFDRTRYNYLTLPGIVAFCFYPGSLPFLFLCMVVVASIAAAIEISVFFLGGKNLVLCALLAQVVASRYAHFGYAPSQSYLLLTALCLNVALLYVTLNLFARGSVK